MKKILLPVLIALVAIAEIAVGFVSVSDIHATQRKDAAIARHKAAVAKEQREVATFRHDIQPLIVQVFDAVQPVQDADDAFENERPGLQVARDDVLGKTAATSTLTSLEARLNALPTPASLKDASTSLSAAIEGLLTATKALAAATKAPGDSKGFVSAYGDGFEQLLSAEDDWSASVDTVFGPTTTLPTPSADRAEAHGRTTPTKGSFIEASDLACAKAEDSLSDLPKLGAVDDVRSNFPRAAAIIRTTLGSLLKTNAPRSAAAFQHQLRVQLKANLVVPAAMEQMSSALKRLDATGYEAALKRYNSAFGSAQAASVAYKGYGVSACAFFFDVDDSAKTGTSTGGGGLST